MIQPRFYNSLTHRLETLNPIEPGRVTMYNCGPTVYDYAHIGNFRSFLFADVLRRSLEFLGYNVTQVMNITDVGHMTDDRQADGGGQDKMALAAQRLKDAKQTKKAGVADVDDPNDPYQVARYFENAFIDDARRLRLRIADEPDRQRPRATDHVADSMIPMIQRLIDNDHAYVADDGAVYYAVESFPAYGQLSGNSLDRLRGGAGGRVAEADQKNKRHPADFLLWKPDETHLMKWDSPWGTGYPGWHIECSAMARATLESDTIDIHTGGEDNIFPHHECEIAQSCGASGNERFANLWLHARYLMVDGEKMSKSRGNFYTLRDLVEKNIDPAVIRLELMRGHYRKNADFRLKGLEESASAVRRLREAARKTNLTPDTTPAPADHPGLKPFVDALADDLNVAGALAAAFEFIAPASLDANDPAEAAAILAAMDSVLAVMQPDQAPDANDEAAELCAAIDAARAAKDFAAADAARDKLQSMGYLVSTTQDGTTAEKKLA
ncbi:cysteine--tRNA ligase [Mucisphaera calidilacus]|uniref:Cysteine--tRNA ligase n=1 Tax=Mucisphaera calidilacus TaxID=2527982 RepID=A0A518BZA0_9BACT|nr:cysteine--tRNA ligase [Mucisphaera calidilacus]QDU72296.1 Cysteine--tRNA ligase [Mucisphaera calidilacus]